MERLGIGCLAHTINLAATSGIGPVANLLTKARKLVTTFHKSDQAATVLKQKHTLLLREKEHKLIQEVSTRWNFTYDMLQRLTELSQVSKF